MKVIKGIWGDYSRVILLTALGLGIFLALMIYKLGSLADGLSGAEIATAQTPVGLHGIYHDALYLPLKLVRSVVFWLAPDHGQTLTRLPNAFFGGLTIASFSWLIWLWHGRRTAVLTSLLFATSAWTLHVSRLASFDVLYLWAVPTLLILQVMLHRHGGRAVVWYGCLMLWSLMLYVPGLVWLVAFHIWLQRQLLIKAWRDFSSLRRQIISSLIGVVFLLPLLVDLWRHHHLWQWLGLPLHWDAPLIIIKHFIGVFVHLFVRGPQYPDLWLGRAPILDVFTLVACGLGIYFYAKNWHAARSRNLGIIFAGGVVLVALNGPVSISLLVPLLYAVAATGIAYLLHEWLKVFPLNPLARGLGIGLISLLVALSCFYNLRAYFVAWPHNPLTRSTFIYHR